MPQRSCVACRTVRSQRDLLRVVRSPDGEVRLDERGRANGRGAYVCRDRACIETAVSRGLLGRALNTSIPASLAAELAAAMPTSISGGSIGQE